MLQIQNNTPFVPGLFVFPNEQGIDTAYVVVKATYSIVGAGLAIAPEQCALCAADEYFGEVAASSLKYAHELHLCKPAADIVLLGTAYAPRGQPARAFDVSLRVGRWQKAIRVYGERVWRRSGRKLVASAPAPITALPIQYEYAYGGSCELDDGTIIAEERNPVGVGVYGTTDLDRIADLLLPALELPSAPFESPQSKPCPAAFGFVPPQWAPRVSYAGTYDEAWQQSRAPYLPEDFDSRFFHAVAPDQIYPDYLKGGEPVELVGLSPQQPVLRFSLPELKIRVRLQVANTFHDVAMNIETLLIEPDLSRLCITFRGAKPCDKQVLRVEQVTID